MRRLLPWIALGALAVFAGLWWRARTSSVAPATIAGGEHGQAAAPDRNAPPTGAPNPELAPTSGAERDAVEVEAAAQSSVGPTIQVTVVGPDREPIGGARVEHLGDASIVRETDERGHCTLPLTPSGDSLPLFVQADAHWHVRVTYERRERVVVELQKAIALFGQIRDAETHQPIPGAEVFVAHQTNCKGCKPDVVVADAHGRYELASAPTRYPDAIVVRAPGYPTDVFPVELAPEPSRVRADFELERGVAVVLRLVDFDDGAPVVGAKITNGSRGGGEMVADERGEWRGPLLVPRDGNEVSLSIRAPDRCFMTGELDVAALSADPLVVIRIPRLAWLTGTVRNNRGEPVAGAVIRPELESAIAGFRSGVGTSNPLSEVARQWQLHANQPARSSTTDEEGRYESRRYVPFVSRVRFEALHPREGRGLSREVALDRTGPTTLDIVLEPADFGSVAGTVKLNGSPARGRVDWRRASHGGSVEIGAAGAYRIEALEGGEVRLEVRPEGYERAPHLFPAATVPLKSGDELRHDFDLKLELAPIAGRVEYVDGHAAANDHLIATCTENRFYRVTTFTDDDGRWLIEVPKNDWTYRVMSKGVAVDGVAPGTTDVRIVVASKARARIAVRDRASGEPIREFLVWWRAEGEPRFREIDSSSAAPLAPNGERVEDLATGPIDLIVAADVLGFAPAIVEGVVLVAGERENRVDVVLDRGGAIEATLAGGTAALEPARPVCAYLEHAYEAARGARHPFDVDVTRSIPPTRDPARYCVIESSQRSGRLEALAAGRYHFLAFPDDVAFEPAFVDVALGKTATVELRWRRR